MTESYLARLWYSGDDERLVYGYRQKVSFFKPDYEQYDGVGYGKQVSYKVFTPKQRAVIAKQVRRLDVWGDARLFCRVNGPDKILFSYHDGMKKNREYERKYKE